MKSTYKKIKIILITMTFFLFLAGCADKEIDTSTLMDDITFEAIEVGPAVNNQTDVMITMTNNSPYKIVQNTVLYLLINPFSESGETNRSAGYLANGNQLNIDPGESVELTASYPSNIFEQNSDVPLHFSERIHFVGYFDKLSENTRYEFTTTPTVGK